MFKDDFVWGAATSAYQIEGAAFEDGKGLSVWDEFCRQEGRIFQGHTGDTACDHYHRYKEDIALMKELGIKAYRFSISWTRILPDGLGRLEEKGVRFYRNLAEELKNQGITPYATLFHWDYPVALMRKGGWLNPDSPRWFEEYAAAVANELGDCIKDFYTFNEPQMMFGNTFVSTNLAPGYRMADSDVIKMIHNMLLAHGLAVQAIRKRIPDARVGAALCSDPVIPELEDERSIEAARELYFKAGDTMEALSFGLTWYSDPLMLGTYPKDGLEKFGKYLPKGWQEDMKTICQPLDYYGQNIYSGNTVRLGEDGKAVPRMRPAGHPKTALDWPIDPEALYWGPRFLYERYQTPVVITENGLSCHDAVSLDGRVHDPNRIDYLNRYLLQLERASEEGICVWGYFHWSLMDNFEWTQGYNERFGLIYIDYETLERIPKDSFYWYKEVVETNGESLGPISGLADGEKKGE